MATTRSATRADVDGIRALQRRAGRSDSAGFVRDLTAAVGDPERLVVVIDDGPIVGWGVTRRFDVVDGIAPAGQYLMGLAVEASHRRRGIGAALIEARAAWIAERADTAWCFADSRNTASIAAHRATGFEEAGRAERIHGVTFTSGIGVLMVRRLGSPALGRATGASAY